MAKLEVRNLTISFRTNNGAVRAVRDISFNLEEGETLAIAGESGSGKSVTTRAIMGILAGNAMVDAGEIIYDGKDLLKIPEEEFHTLRGHKLAMVFQDPLSALNPIMRIGKQLTEAMLLNNKERRRDGKERFNSLLAQLEKTMVADAEARGQGAQAREAIHAKTKQFDQFASVGLKMEYTYKEAMEAIVECMDGLDEIDDAILKGKDKDVREICGRVRKSLKHIFDPYTFDESDADIAQWRTALEQFQKNYTRRREDDMRALMTDMTAKLGAMVNAQEPNFFCIGYLAASGKNPDPKKQSISELNQMARETLDREFMTDFLQDIAHALQYSSQQAAKAQQAAADALRSALKVYEQHPLNEGECKDALHKSAAAVEAAIDKLQLNKDNQAYVYRSGALSYIERYASSKTHNPKEEKRYARDLKKFEAQKAKGKTPPSVIPKNLIDADMAQHNLCEMTKSLLKHFEELIAASEAKDFDVLAVEMVDYMKARAQDYAFKLTKGMARHRAIELMKEVGIPEPHKRFSQYPFEFSGGMRQRIVIAIALSANPDILICDEPTTALDVTIQAQILELINRLKKERRLSVIFITHDLGVVANMADRIAIMYAGKIVEYGTADDVFYDPRHPYTWALLSSMPDLETREKLEAIPGTPPDMILPPKGDAFAARNKYAMEIDFEEQPPMFHVSETHMAATWLLHPNAPKVNPPAIVTERIERMKKEQAEREAAEALQNAKKGATEA